MEPNEALNSALKGDKPINITLNVNFPGIASGLAEILAAIKTLTRKVDTMSQEVDDMTAEVEAVKTVQASAVTLIVGLHDLLVAAGTDPAKLAALRNDLKASKDALAAAVVANTPAAPTPPMNM